MKRSEWWRKLLLYPSPFSLFPFFALLNSHLFLQSCIRRPPSPHPSLPSFFSLSPLPFCSSSPFSASPPPSLRPSLLPVYSPALRVLMATGVVPFHTPDHTSPKFPEPNFFWNCRVERSISHSSLWKPDNNITICTHTYTVYCTKVTTHTHLPVGKTNCLWHIYSWTWNRQPLSKPVRILHVVVDEFLHTWSERVIVYGNNRNS